MTNPPTILTNNSMMVTEGSASAADSNGNLLFYTDGSTIWNQSHSVMANGTGLYGDITPTQSSLILKKPGSTNLYYIFTVQGGLGSAGVNYSIVDMSLATGMGSVTVKNATLVPFGCPEKITGTRHCNGIDFWILTHDFNSTNYRAFLLSSTGISGPVISPAGMYLGLPFGANYGAMKLSPNSRKLLFTNPQIGLDLLDFDNSTGIVSNSFTIALINLYGVEFSPDGSKIYAGTITGSLSTRNIVQYDLCAGSNSAITASQFTMITSSTNNVGGLQLASDGKIYIAVVGQQSVGVINYPNNAGPSCSLVITGQSLGPKSGLLGLPNFASSFLLQKPIVAPVTYSVNNNIACQTASFTAPITTSVFGCAASGTFSLTGIAWDFGDPVSGPLNTSFSTNPSHYYASLGSYTTQLVLYYSCGGGTDTIRQVVNINQPCISVSSTSITCANLGSATVSTFGGAGPYSYTWIPTSQTNSVANGLSPGTYTIAVYDALSNKTYTATTTFIPLIPLTGSLSSTSSLTCFGVNNATATVNNLAGGSGNQNYLWSHSAGTQSSVIAVGLVAGIHSVTVTDALTGCVINQTFAITQPPAMTLNIASSSASACAGKNITFTATSLGGIPGYSYFWSAGPLTFSSSVSQTLAGNYVYSVTSIDANTCSITNTVSASFINNPIITISNVSICPLQTGTLQAFGANTFTWSNLSVNSTFTDSPISSTLYTVTGAALGCTSAATASIILKPTPVIVISSNSPKCNGQTLNLNSSIGVSYLWNGPVSYTSGNQNPTINNASPINSGVYSMTLTGANTCTAGAILTVVINPTPTLSIQGGTTCVNDQLILSASSFTAATYFWTGPNTFTSNSQSPFFAISSQSMTGNYTVVATSVNSCTNSGIASALVKPLPSVSISNVSICPLETGTLVANGATTYTWNGAFIGSVFSSSPGSSQQYSVLGAALGCTAAATASIIVKPLPSPTIADNSPICNGQTLLLSASGGTSYLWNGPLSFGSSAQNPSISPAAPNRSGVYNLTVTAANSCTAPGSTSVLVNPTPTISMNGGQVCLNSSLFLSASSFTGSTYFWSGPNSFTSSLQNPTISAVTFSAAGNYSLLVNSVSSCTNVSSVGVTVNPLPTISINPTSSVICVGKSSTLTVSGGLSYLWNTGSSLTVFVVSPTITTAYTVVGTSALGCTNAAVRSISVNVLPSVSVVVNPTVYCAGKSATLTASGANTYTWSNNASSSSIIQSPAFTSFYNVRGTSAVTGCSNTAFATVSVNPLPSLTVSATKTIICTGTSASITASGANTYTWLPGNLTGANISPSPSVNTTYTVRGLISASGCTNTAVRTISVNKTPTISMVSNTPSLCVGWSALITPSGALTYTLNPGNLTGTSFSVTPASTAQYSLSGTNSVSCVNLIPSNVNIVVHNLKAIQGVVTSTTGQNNGMVVLYKYKTGLGKWDSLTNAVLILSNYNFPAMPPGSYVVKAVPFPTDLVETYGLNASSWKGANVINHGCIANSVQNINVITFNNTIKSKATLSGKITQGAGYAQPGSPGTGIPNITVKAGIYPGQVIYQTTKTNALGQYTLANMAPNVSGQNYYILVDIPALDTNKTYHRIIITGFENFTNLDFVVDSQRIHPMNLKVGVKEFSLLNSNIKVYPNPVTDQITIELELTKTEEVSMELFDLTGRKVKTLISQSQLDKGKLSVLAKVEELSEGAYLLKVKIGEEEGAMKIVLAR